MTYYDGVKVFDEYDDDHDWDVPYTLITLIEDGLFHIGSSGNKDDDNKTKTIVCKICNGKEFNVGKDTWWTGIKCVKCGWEVCIHEG